MRSVRLLIKRVLLLSFKVVLVAIPTVVASYYSYRAGAQDSIENYHAMVDIAASLERQGPIIEQMRGEINVLKMLAAARTGSGFRPLPVESDSCSDNSHFTWKTSVPSGKNSVALKRLTTRN